MKHLGKAFAGLFALGLIGISLLPQPAQEGVTYNTELNALSIAGASAQGRYKAWCDGSTYNSCTIHIVDGTVLNGDGQPRAEW